MNFKRNRLAKITWEDSISSHTSDPEDSDFVITYSVGWITRNNRRGVTISSMKTKIDFGEHTFIPRGCIKKVRYL